MDGMISENNWRRNKTQRLEHAERVAVAMGRDGGSKMRTKQDQLLSTKAKAAQILHTTLLKQIEDNDNEREVLEQLQMAMEQDRSDLKAERRRMRGALNDLKLPSALNRKQLLVRAERPEKEKVKDHVDYELRNQRMMLESRKNQLDRHMQVMGQILHDLKASCIKVAGEIDDRCRNMEVSRELMDGAMSHADTASMQSSPSRAPTAPRTAAPPRSRQSGGSRADRTRNILRPSRSEARSMPAEGGHRHPDLRALGKETEQFVLKAQTLLGSSRRMRSASQEAIVDTERASREAASAVSAAFRRKMEDTRKIMDDIKQQLKATMKALRVKMEHSAELQGSVMDTEGPKKRHEEQKQLLQELRLHDRRSVLKMDYAMQVSNSQEAEAHEVLDMQLRNLRVDCKRLEQQKEDLEFDLQRMRAAAELDHHCVTLASHLRSLPKPPTSHGSLTERSHTRTSASRASVLGGAQSARGSHASGRLQGLQRVDELR